ncbi:hypothetical protein PR048_029102 [Dryococelus australis]|uniref:Uncharacterized protein n=1 Tax=Dryococelus australis TaxID=614101 RepID=A0ABQ9GFW4_9NEOP|nr:hypothetical protein PR048_029102 [Dryococelus australis]
MSPYVKKKLLCLEIYDLSSVTCEFLQSPKPSRKWIYSTAVALVNTFNIKNSYSAVYADESNSDAFDVETKYIESCTNGTNSHAFDIVVYSDACDVEVYSNVCDIEVYSNIEVCIDACYDEVNSDTCNIDVYSDAYNVDFNAFDINLNTFDINLNAFDINFEIETFRFIISYQVSESNPLETNSVLEKGGGGEGRSPKTCSGVFFVTLEKNCLSHKVIFWKREGEGDAPTVAITLVACQPPIALNVYITAYKQAHVKRSSHSLTDLRGGRTIKTLHLRRCSLLYYYLFCDVGTEYRELQTHPTLLVAARPTENVSQHAVANETRGSFPEAGATSQRTATPTSREAPRHFLTRSQGDEGVEREVCSSAGMKGRGKREIPEKNRRQTASSGTIPTCENSQVTQPGFEPGSTWWEASSLTAQVLRYREEAGGLRVRERGHLTVGCHSRLAERLVNCVRARRRLVARADSWESRSLVCSSGAEKPAGGGGTKGYPSGSCLGRGRIAHHLPRRRGKQKMKATCVGCIVSAADAKRRGKQRGREAVVNSQRRDCDIPLLSSEPMRVIEVSMEQRKHERAGETGDPRENPPTNCVVRHDSQMRKFPHDLARDLFGFALVGGEWANRSAIAAPCKQSLLTRPVPAKQAKPTDKAKSHAIHRRKLYSELHTIIDLHHLHEQNRIKAAMYGDMRELSVCRNVWNVHLHDNSDDDHVTSTNNSKLDIGDGTVCEDDHEDSINDNDYDDSVDEVYDKKDDDSIDIPTHFTNFPATSGVKKATTSEMKKAGDAENTDYMFTKDPNELVMGTGSRSPGSKIAVGGHHNVAAPVPVSDGSFVPFKIHCLRTKTIILLTQRLITYSPAENPTNWEPSQHAATNQTQVSFPDPRTAHQGMDTPASKEQTRHLASAYLPTLCLSEVIEARIEERWNEDAGLGTGYPRGNPPASDIVRHDCHIRKIREWPGRGLYPVSPWWGASSLTAQQPWPPPGINIRYSLPTSQYVVEPLMAGECLSLVSEFDFGRIPLPSQCVILLAANLTHKQHDGNSSCADVTVAGKCQESENLEVSTAGDQRASLLVLGNARSVDLTVK